MKSKAPFDAYADFYDLLYKNKDYKGESAYIDQLMSKFLKSDRKKASLLDLACGTGRHLQELYKVGYRNLSGSDISKPMIEIAVKGAAEKGQDIRFHNYSFQKSNKIAKKFDVVISMFSAVNYITTYADQCKTLSNVHGLLNKNGLFIFDYWNGCAVTDHFSPVKVLRKKNGDSEIIRISETSLDLINQEATIKFTCNYMKKDKRKLQFEETHRLHYYYFSEMKNLLESNSFEIVHISPFMQIDKALSPNDWNVNVIVRKLI